MWAILVHYAEMKLFLGVLDLFKNCHSVSDMWDVIRNSDDITGLGIVAATSIAATACGALLKMACDAAGLSGALARVRALIQRLRG
jgi:hypothetical protein